MSREYTIRPRGADIDRSIDGERYLARDVIETDETVDIGITDQFGNKIVARQKRDPVGFIRWPSAEPR